MAATWKELKDSPLFILTGVVIATAAVTGGVYEKVLLPERVAQEVKTSAASQLQAMADQYASEVRVASEAAASEVKKAHQEADDAKAKLFDYEQSHLFLDNSPYPAMLGKVKVGDPIETLDSVFPSNKIDRSQVAKGLSYIAVHDADPLFSDIAYYYDGADKKHRITHIYFSTSWSTKISDSLLHDRFVEMFGQPEPNPVHERYRWKTPKADVFMSDSKSFIVMRPGFVPGFW